MKVRQIIAVNVTFQVKTFLIMVVQDHSNIVLTYLRIPFEELSQRNKIDLHSARGKSCLKSQTNQQVLNYLFTSWKGTSQVENFCQKNLTFPSHQFFEWMIFFLLQPPQATQSSLLNMFIDCSYPLHWSYLNSEFQNSLTRVSKVYITQHLSLLKTDTPGLTHTFQLDDKKTNSFTFQNVKRTTI